MMQQALKGVEFDGRSLGFHLMVACDSVIHVCHQACGISFGCVAGVLHGDGGVNELLDQRFQGVVHAESIRNIVFRDRCAERSARD